MGVSTNDLDRRTFRRWFLAIVTVAGSLRVLYVVVAKRDESVVGDQLHYFAQAARIADGRWFEHPWIEGVPSALHAPLTALALAPVSWVDSELIFTQRLTMAVYGTLVVAGLGVLARHLFDRRTTLVATGIAAVYANLWMNDGLIMSETFATAGVIAVLVTAYRYDARPTTWRAGAMGVAVALAGLARAELLLLGVVVAVPMIVWRARRTGSAPVESVARIAVAGATALLVISPWVIRNQVRFDEPVFMSTQDGLTLLGANCEPTYYGPGIGFWALGCADDVEVPPDADESVRSARYRSAAVDYVGDHLDRVPVVVLARLGRGLSVWEVDTMLDFNTFEGRERWAGRIGLWQYWLLLPFAAWGLRAWTSPRPRWPLVAVAGLSVLTLATVYGIVRFRVGMEVGLVLSGAVGFRATWDALRRRRRTAA